MPFYCPVAYNPKRGYTRQEMIELITPQRELLCFFAQASGYPQPVLGLDFDSYDPRTGTVPVHVMGKQQAKLLIRAEGAKFKQALATVQAGDSVLVTYTSATCTGWFKLGWALPEEGRVRTA